MGTTYRIVNRTRREVLGFLHVDAWKKRELTGNPAAAAITTWYMIECAGDEVAFVSDEGEWPFGSGSWDADSVSDWPDVTSRVVEQLIAAEILEDHGVAWADEDEPETIYVRDLRNVWMDADGPAS